jgi:hypothetical protein
MNLIYDIVGVSDVAVISGDLHTLWMTRVSFSRNLLLFAKILFSVTSSNVLMIVSCYCKIEIDVSQNSR